MDGCKFIEIYFTEQKNHTVKKINWLIHKHTMTNKSTDFDIETNINLNTVQYCVYL